MLLEMLKVLALPECSPGRLPPIMFLMCLNACFSCGKHQLVEGWGLSFGKRGCEPAKGCT